MICGSWDSRSSSARTGGPHDLGALSARDMRGHGADRSHPADPKPTGAQAAEGAQKVACVNYGENDLKAALAVGFIVGMALGALIMTAFLEWGKL